MMNKLSIRAHAAPWHNGVEILVKTKGAHGTSVNLESHGEGEYYGPTMTIGLTEAQALMDDLWHAGLRPTEGSGSAGAMRAAERHLDDMRRIVASKLDVDLCIHNDTGRGGGI